MLRNRRTIHDTESKFTSFYANFLRNQPLQQPRGNPIKPGRNRSSMHLRAGARFEREPKREKETRQEDEKLEGKLGIAFLSPQATFVVILGKEIVKKGEKNTVRMVMRRQMRIVGQHNDEGMSTCNTPSRFSSTEAISSDRASTKLLCPALYRRSAPPLYSSASWPHSPALSAIGLCAPANRHPPRCRQKMLALPGRSLVGPLAPLRSPFTVSPQ
ncbi:hypothetical protein L484_027836 [Morus notabilis]|uniref:Uncharacterized protein n=1 Tax=Morus notabilis TaxID=981085 RepID=W9RL31_9ROSA|nr:hypothetical protein L484_027836 [Morus notabilis]